MPRKDKENGEESQSAEDGHYDFIRVGIGASDGGFKTLKDDDIDLLRETTEKVFLGYERAGVEEALSRAIEFHEAVLVNMNEGLLTVDQDGVSSHDESGSGTGARVDDRRDARTEYS